MEYGWPCLSGESVEFLKMKSMKCRIAIFTLFLVLVLLLTFVVAAYSYAGEALTLEEVTAFSEAFNPDTHQWEHRGQEYIRGT
jgi:hypothetical protein